MTIFRLARSRSVRLLTLASAAGVLATGCGLDFAKGSGEPAPCDDVTLPVLTTGEDPENLGESVEALSTEAPADAGALDVLIALEPGQDAPRTLDFKSTRELMPPISGRLSTAPTAEMTARVTPRQLEDLRRTPGVRLVEEDRPVYAMGLAETHALSQTEAYAEDSTQEAPWGVQRVGALDLWDADRNGVLDLGAPNGQGVKVCVIDTGIDPTHPDLRDVYRGGYDFVDNDSDPTDASGDKRGSGHGTHVAATIAAQLGAGGKSNGMLAPGGVVGVAPGIELYAVRVLNTEGSGRTSNTINAIRWCAENDMDIASLSLGSDRKSELEREAFDAAYATGMLIFAATGNAGVGEPVAYPGAYESTIAIGAIDVRNDIGGFSQRGPEVELVAPGVNILSATLVDGGVVPSLTLDGQAIEARAMSRPGDIEDEVIDCGLGDSVRSCEQLRCGGFVAYVRRGKLEFAEKVRNVVAQGASAVIIGNDDAANPDDPGRFTLGEGGPFPPTASISRSTARSLEDRLGRGVRARVELRGIDYARMSGTSMATPHAAGVAALLWSANPDLTHEQLRGLLQETAMDLGDVGRDETFGFGLVQASSSGR